MTDSDTAPGFIKLTVTDLVLPVDDSERDHHVHEIEQVLLDALEDYEENINFYDGLEDPTTADTSILSHAEVRDDK